MSPTARTVDARRAGERGVTLIETLVTIGVTALLLGSAVLVLHGNFMEFSSSTQRLLNDLRTTRADAVTRGAHYRVTFEGSAYRIERLQDNDRDGQWDVDTAATQSVRAVSWPAGVTASVEGNQGSGAGPCVEFNTRGLLVPAADSRIAEMARITMLDSVHDRSKMIHVWPSGQMGFAKENQSSPED